MLTLFVISALLSICPGNIAMDAQTNLAKTSNSPEIIDSVKYPLKKAPTSDLSLTGNVHKDQSLPIVVPEEAEKESMGGSITKNWKWLEDIVESEINEDLAEEMGLRNDDQSSLNSNNEVDDLRFDYLEELEMVLDDIEFLNDENRGKSDSHMLTVTDSEHRKSNPKRVSPVQRKVRWNLPENHQKIGPERLRKVSMDESKYNQVGSGDELVSDSSRSVQDENLERGNTREKILYDSGAFPDLPLNNEINYPANIEDFHEDMPKIADEMQGVEFEVDPFVRVKNAGNKEIEDSEMLILPAQTSIGRISPEQSTTQQVPMVKSRDESSPTQVSDDQADVMENDDSNSVETDALSSEELKSLSNDFNDIPLFSDEIPYISLSDDIEYPTDIDYFHNDMPQIADQLEGIDLVVDPYVRKEENKTPIYKSINGKEMQKKINRHLFQKMIDGIRIVSETENIRPHKFVNVPWKFLKPGDLVNWPQDVQYTRIFKLNAQDLQKVYENLHSINFSHGALLRLAHFGNKDLKSPTSSKAAPSDKNADGWGMKRNWISKVLNGKLKEQTNRKSVNVPWSSLVSQDIVGWPENVRLQRPWYIPTKDIQHIIDRLPLLEFSKQFIDDYMATVPEAVVKNARMN